MNGPLVLDLVRFGWAVERWQRKRQLRWQRNVFIVINFIDHTALER